MRTRVLQFALAAGTLAGLASDAYAQTTVTIIDQTGDVGLNPAMAVDSTGRGLVAYYDRAQTSLKVARCQDVRCTSAIVTTIDLPGDVGRFASVAFGSDGRGIVSYADLTGPALKVAHCSNDACTTATAVPVDGVPVAGRTAIAIGADGLPLVAYVSGGLLRIAHCSDAACTTSTRRSFGLSGPDATLVMAADGFPLMATAAAGDGAAGITHCGDATCSTVFPANPPLPIFNIETRPTGLALGSDGRPLMASLYREDPFVPPGSGAPIEEARFSHCTNAICNDIAPTFGAADCCHPPDVAGGSTGFGWFAYAAPPAIRLRTCLDAACSSTTESCAVVSPGGELAVERAGDGRPLIAFHREGGGLGVAHGVSDPCPTPRIDVTDAIANEAGGSMLFPVRLAVAAAVPVTVSYATMAGAGTAVANVDYVPVQGTLTFAPGQTVRDVAVPLLADGQDEPDETLLLRLSSATAAMIGDGNAIGTLVDSDPTELAAGDCEALEADAGTTACVVTVQLVHGAAQATVTVHYQTGGGTALPGTDYVPASGMLTFFLGTTSLSVPVSVIGDTAVELDETFLLTLANPVNATIGDGQGEARIRDDDAPSLSSRELTHGSRVTADLAPAPGPIAAQDVYRLAQPPYSSWEVVMDEVSGDAAPGLQVERLAEDNATVLQGGSVVGTGPGRVLRWQMRSALSETRQHIRVGSPSCGTGCGPDDTYRLRVYETTGRIPRFNNTATQITVLILQNASSRSVGASVDFWTTGGVLRASVSIPLDPRGTAVLNTSTIPALTGLAGSITVTHDGGYGALTGKAVALEPATGFSFDSPMVSKPR